MARRLRNNRQIDEYVAFVVEAANDHAPHIASTVQLLADEVRTRLDLAADLIEVYERQGIIARTCWVTIGDQRYVFTYNYEDECIDLKNGSIQGTLRFQFKQSTSTTAMKRQVATL